MQSDIGADATCSATVATARIDGRQLGSATASTAAAAAAAASATFAFTATGSTTSMSELVCFHLLCVCNTDLLHSLSVFSRTKGAMQLACNRLSIRSCSLGL
eukprot:657146-Hanusia_phi.AAC.5